MPQSRKRQVAKGRRPAPQTFQKKQTAPSKSNNRSTQIIAGVIIAAVLAAGLVYFFTRGKGQSGSGNEVTTASGLKYVDLVEGTGEPPKPGQTVVVDYTGTLQDGTKFDSSKDSGHPFSFVIGGNGAIRGFEEGVRTMKVGGKRRLIIPPKIGYGAQAKPNIPANSTLIFEVELLGIKNN
jgi:peptidylprolyl isomerase